MLPAPGASCRQLQPSTPRTEVASPLRRLLPRSPTLPARLTGLSSDLAPQPGRSQTYLGPQLQETDSWGAGRPVLIQAEEQQPGEGTPGQDVTVGGQLRGIEQL